MVMFSYLSANCYMYQYCGAPLDYEKAITYYKRSAELGYDKAQYQLGLLYVRGTGVEEDLLTAAMWFDKAAVQAHPDALYELGYMLQRGSGVPTNLLKAHACYKKSSSLPNPNHLAANA